MFVGISRGLVGLAVPVRSVNRPMQTMYKLPLRAVCQSSFCLPVRSFHNCSSLRSEIKADNKQKLPAKTDSTHQVPANPVISHSFSSRLGKVVKWSVFTAGIVASGVVAIILGFFIYDSTTYKSCGTPIEIKVPKLALDPEMGGPENLPILRETLDAYDSEVKELTSYKPKLVVLGSGWASVGLLKTLNPGDYDVTVVSPQNYFLFTPLLPSAATGTLEVKSLMASIRKIVNDVNGHYLEAYAEKVELDDKLIKVSQVNSKTGAKESFYLPYDKLVVAVGSTSNTHGVEGLEYCSRLKTAEDAITIRKKIKTLLERACLPTTTDEERRNLLSFVVCGGGPTGVEFAAEVFDLLNEDLPNMYPRILRQQLSVHVIQSRSNILNTYDEKISEYATQRFRKETIDVLTNSRVERILPDRVIFNQKNDETGEIEMKELPFGICLWSTGVSQNPLTKQVVQSLSHSQRNKRAIETDSHLRIIGAPTEDVYAIGDCATVRTDLADHTADYIRKFIVNRHLSLTRSNEIITDEDIKHLSLSYTEIIDIAKQVARRHPQTREHLIHLEDDLPKYDVTGSGQLNFDQIYTLLHEVETKVTSLPATAQRALQQGKYLGKKLTKVARAANTANTVHGIHEKGIDEKVYRPFSYVHLGSLAYIGNSAVFDLPGYSFVGGLIAMYLWRSIYFAQTVSWRTRVLLFMDWLKRGMFGRDILSE
ncbi:unnamed protein product [Kluyveromyces dobzhanskii CBS 2104]|uniref:WGS project CCBQ000000000 data, contig 00107 n=1 Tax=Kluyveromyces dobzhanskii CBS 2104 TaxID=1427455 RepID=A0A0A8KYZ8_9SACH|nr:unnamed protein product [Kluyveromyces dobzhanskii CBS 2104]